MGIVVYCDAGSNLFNYILKNKNLDVNVLSMTLDVDDRSMKLYDENLNLDEFASEFYNKMRKGCKVKTALVSTGLLLEEFKKQVDLGNQVICFTMSKNISGTYQSANIAAEEINSSFGKKMVYIVDSMTAGFGEGMQALSAAQDIKEGYSFDEVCTRADDRVFKTRSEFMVDDAKYLAKTGRVNPIVAKIASVLGIKVLLYGSPRGKIEMTNKVHGRMMALKTMTKVLLSHIKDNNSIVYISHCDCLEDANRLKKFINDGGVPNVEIHHHDFVTGAHIGPGSIAVFYEGINRD
ncbi:MAG: DegV family protein [Bacillales bacterium]|nr:DegV family protein [Bacillales bacterium]